MFPFAYTATYLAADDTNSSPAYHVVPFKQDTIQDTIYLSLLNLDKSHLHEWSGAIFEGYKWFCPLLLCWFGEEYLRKAQV